MYSTVFCNKVECVLKKLGVTQYDPNNWRLFIDSCKRSLKCVLLHNGNDFGSIPLGHSTILKEKYIDIKFVLEKNWLLQAQRDHMSGSENGWIFVGITKRIYLVSMLYLLVG